MPRHDSCSSNTVRNYRVSRGASCHHRGLAVSRRSLNLWVTVLAGGSGLRLAPLTGGVPKQFWSLDGGPTFLEQTLERIAPLAPAERTVVVVDRTHRPMVERLGCSERAAFVYQPCNRGTAAGVLLGLTPALDSDRDPIVLITPSDHGVWDAVAFRNAVTRAVTWVRARPDQIGLFGAEPSGPDGDYGWIDAIPGEAVRRNWGFAPVASFIEKPPPAQAADLMASGAAWNTMVVVALASTLLTSYERHAPAIRAAFDPVLRLPPRERASYLERAYVDLWPADFCRDLLTPATNLWVSVWPASLGWSDLGTPERLSRWRAMRAAAHRPGAAGDEAVDTDRETRTTHAEVTQ